MKASQFKQLIREAVRDELRSVLREEMNYARNLNESFTTQPSTPVGSNFLAKLNAPKPPAGRVIQEGQTPVRPPAGMSGLGNIFAEVAGAMTHEDYSGIQDTIHSREYTD